MLNVLQKKLESLAEKYIDLVEKQIEETLQGDNNIDFEKINEGIRMINHVSCAIYKLSACKEEKQALNESN